MKTPEEMFNEYYNLVETTAYRMLGNPTTVAKTNGIDVDDIYQVGREALWKACLKWDEAKGDRTFQNYAIYHIRWGISQGTKKLSRKINHRGRIAKDDEIKNNINFTSMDKKINDDEESVTYHEVITSGYSVENDVMNREVVNYIRDNFDSRTLDILNLRSKGMILEEIAQKYNVSRERIRQKIVQVRKNLEKAGLEVV